jgi:hypothetical protein
MIPRVHTTSSRATTAAAGLAAEHDSKVEALTQLGTEVDRAKPEMGEATVCPMLGGGDEEPRAAAAVGPLVGTSGRPPEGTS